MSEPSRGVPDRDDGAGALIDLGAAAVSMLEPLLDAERREGVFRRLADAIRVLGGAGDDHGVRSLNYLAALIVPLLRRLGDGVPAADDVERAERWVGDAIAFCGGQLQGDDALRLVAQLLDWPGFAPLQPRFATLIEARLRDDASRLAAWSEQADRSLIQRDSEMASEVDADEVAGVDADLDADDDDADADVEEDVEVDAPATHDAPPDVVTTAAPTAQAAATPPGAVLSVARDELALLGEAADLLDDDVRHLFESVGPAESAWQHALDDLCESLSRLGAAAGQVGLPPLAAVLDALASGIRRDAPALAAGDVPLREGLGNLPRRLLAWCEAPGAQTAAALVALVSPVDVAGQGAMLAQQLADVRLVASRRVVLDDAIQDRSQGDQASALSLAIPDDADPGSVDPLRREVAALAARFTDCVAVFDGGADALDEARRIAHTLKGAAQTAGVRAVALLTHRLEDLLQLAAADGIEARRALHPLLIEAADCLEEMAERLGHGSQAPASTAHLVEALETRIRARLDDGATAPANDPIVAQAGDDRPAGLDAGTGGLPDDEVGHADGDAADAVLPDALMRADDWVRLPSDRYEALLARSGEATIALARLREQVSRVSASREMLRDGGERIQDLAGELERLVDLRSLQLTRPAAAVDGRDPSALQEFDELHEVSRRIAEAALDARQADQDIERQLASLRDLTGQLERLQGETRETLIDARRSPVSSIVPRLQRIVRQAARLVGLEIDLVVAGQSLAVDDPLLQSLLEPLGHLLRNAVDHGVGNPAGRRALGKPPAGRIDVAFASERGRLQVSVRDDGQGLDREAVLRRARGLGWWTAATPPDDARLAGWVLAPGFSVRDTASALSGRGIGLDVVARSVTVRGGRLTLDPGVGTGLQVTLSLPMGPVARPVMVLRSATHVLALSTRGLLRIDEAPAAADDDAAAPAGGATTLASALGLPPQALPMSSDDARLLWVEGADGGRSPLLAPSPATATEVLVEPLPAMLAPVAGIVGTTVLPDGAVAPVIDLPDLLARRAPSVAGSLDIPVDAAPVCLVVDDSPSVRRATIAFVRDLGLQAVEAVDGRDALARIEHRRPDIVLVDMEMPRMNGLEFVAALRAGEQGVRLPVVMITSRAAERHRRRAMDAGVDAFLGKPAGEDELAQTIRRLLAASPGDDDAGTPSLVR